MPKSNEDVFALVVVMTGAPPGGAGEFLSESFAFGASHGGARGCRALPKYIILGLVPMPWIRLA